MNPMKDPILIIAAIVLIFGIYMDLSRAAELVETEYPYDIFNDGYYIRWCMEADEGDEFRSCWAMGKETWCKILPAEDGYIDCSINPPRRTP